jgi:RNA polymerase-binding transcription factor
MKRAQNNSRRNNPRNLLLAKKAELVGNLDETRFDTLASLGRMAEEDQAQLSHEEFISLRRNSMDYEMLRQVEEALERVDSGSYGICQNCEESISERRLQAVPWARYCLSCQERISSGLDSDVAELAGAGTRP